ncbi:hypothetical protein JCM14469_29960 [Desulfatiferula olefinivorans]
MQPRILIVDDEEPIRQSLARHFAFRGYETETAQNGRSALAVMEQKAFQVVISDIMMPVMTGIDLLKRIRKDYPMTRVIMITGYVTLENALACLRYNADTCIFKPIEDLGELDRAVDTALHYLDHWKKKLTALSAMHPDGETHHD